MWACVLLEVCDGEKRNEIAHQGAEARSRSSTKTEILAHPLRGALSLRARSHAHAGTLFFFISSPPGALPSSLSTRPAP